MKHLLRVPTNEQYAYIEAEYEGDANGAVEAYLSLTAAVRGGSGVGIKKLAQIIHEYCTTGVIVNGGDLDFSLNEKTLLGEIKKLIRKEK
jgi:hypothetical protein